MFDCLAHYLPYSVFINVVHREVLYAMDFEGLVLIWIDISNPYQHYVFGVEERVFIEPVPIVELWYFGDASEVCEWHAVVVGIGGV
jgi:hypothetical protein